MPQTTETPRASSSSAGSKDCSPDLDALREKLREVLDQAKPLMEQLQSAAQDARASSLAARHNLEAHVRERPLTSLLIAAGFGFLLASLRRR